MAPVVKYLIDNTSSHLVDVFPQAQTLEGFGLQVNATDPEIFRTACEYGLTIVSENDRHFRALMQDAANRSGKRNCAGDGFGLVVPNHRSGIRFDDLTRRLHFAGTLVTWDEVRDFNLRVSIGQNSATVNDLPRCKFCREATDGPRARQLFKERD